MSDYLNTSDANLTARTLKGFRWTYGATAIGAILQLAYTAVVSRILHPADFGLVALASVFLRFGSYFAEMGVGAAIVQKRELAQREFQAAFASTVLLGATFTIVIAAGAPLAAHLFTAPHIVPVVRAMALTLLLNALGIPAMGILRRRLRFQALAVAEVTSYVLGYLVVGIGMAMRGFGVWSLVGAALTQSFSQSLLLLAATRHPLSIKFAWSELKAIYSFGGRMTAISFLEFIGLNLDTMAVGRFAGVTALGQYNRANMLVVLPLEKATSAMTRVLFPVYSKIQGNMARARNAYIESMQFTAGLLLPAAVGLALAAREVVGVLLGSRWSVAATVLPVIAVAYTFNYLSVFAGILCEANGRLREKLGIQLAFDMSLGGLLWANRHGSLISLAAVVGLCMFGQHCAYQVVVARVFGLRTKDFVKIYVPGLATAIAIASAVFPITRLCRAHDVGDVSILCLQLGAGAGILVLSALLGPLRGVRATLRDRVNIAVGQESGGSSTFMTLLMRILDIGNAHHPV